MNVGSDRGFTIIEVMVGIFLLLIGVLGTVLMADNANGVASTTKARVGATNLVREMLEDAKTFKYADLTGALPASGASTVLQTDFANAGLADAFPSKPNWQVTRRGIAYDVSAFTCVVDDPHDGIRAAVSPGNPDTNTAGDYCKGTPDAGSTATTDTNPDDARKLEVSIKWTIHGQTPSCAGTQGTTSSPPLSGIGRACVAESELIANPSGGLGPAITAFSKQPASPPTVEGAAGSVDFTATTATPAQSVTWNADDGQSGAAATTDNTHWTFTWSLPALTPQDGTHILTTQAFLLNAGGVPRQLAVKLNRFIPRVPQTAGSGVDRRKLAAPAAAINWQQNSGNDIIGYTVYRVPCLASASSCPTAPDPTSDTPVCSTASVSSTLCFDAPGPAPNDLSTVANHAACPATAGASDVCINYYVVPFDQMWTTLSNPTSYDSTTNCPGAQWGSPAGSVTSVNVPTPPVTTSRSVAPLTASPLWSSARAGCASAFVNVDLTTGLTATAPNPPNLAAPTCTTSSNGQPVINWSAPTSGGPTVSQYRIYRDPPQTPPDYNDDAFTINNAQATSFTDPDPIGGTGHTYYVTSMTNTFQESSELAIPWTAAGCP